MADPTASDIVITYDGAEIVNDGSSGVIYASARFESQNAAQPGTFEFTVRDPNRVLSFVTGKDITLTVDGVLLFGGFVTQVTRKFALPVDDTSRPVKSRQWVLRGVDYNILFDKRVLRNTSNYLERLPKLTGDPMDGEVVRRMTREDPTVGYIDVPAGFDTQNYVEDVASANADDVFIWMQQGTTWREAMRNTSLLTGAIWYLDANKRLIWRALENSEAKWGFSDVPNNSAVSASPVQFQGATIGFRDADIVEDGSFIVNDAFVWGGSEFTGSEGGTVFSRYDAETSIDAHGRWQLSETHFGQLASQRQVDARSRVIVNGSPTELQPGSVEGDSVRGLRFSQWQVKFTWYAHDVPKIAGIPDHIRPGDLTTMIFYVLGQGNAHPLIQTLPARQIRISFPQLNPEGDSYVQFEGYFSLQPDDPYTLWSYLRENKKTVQPPAIATSSGSSGTTTYGSFGQFAPIPDPDGSTRVFDLPSDYGYLANTTQVYLNGILMLKGTHYEETDPAGGVFTLFSAPTATDRLWVTARTTSGTAVTEGIIGYGATTTGGQGGVVYNCTNFSQLRTALEASGARIINLTGSAVFDGQGAEFNVRNGNLTVDGTGWTGSMKDYKIVFQCSNVIIKEVAWRPGEGDTAGASADRRAISFNAGNDGDVLDRIVLMNSSFAWGPDVVASFINNVTNATVQNCIIGPGLDESNILPHGIARGFNVTTPGNSDPDAIWVKRITFYRNLSILCDQRNLKYEHGQWIDSVNNAIYDWGTQAGHGNPRGANIVGNMFKKGPETTGSDEVWEPDTNYPEYDDSTYFPLSGSDANIGIGFTPTVDIDPAARLSTYYGGGLYNVTVETASESLFNSVVMAAGRTYQDPVDTLIKQHALDGTSDGFYNGTGYPAPHPSW